MMRPGRRASLLVALYLLASAAPAAAQSAWVLWSTYVENQTEPKTSTTQHTIRRVFESQSACEQTISGEVRSHIRTWSSTYEQVNVSPVDPNVMTAKQPKNSAGRDDSLLVRVSCWPVGLEPKGILGGATYPNRDVPWVLWKEVSRPAGPDVWLLYEAYESKAECESGNRSYVQTSLRSTERPGMKRELKSAHVIITRESETGKEVRSEEFHCFPNGTDPRPRNKD